MLRWFKAGGGGCLDLGEFLSTLCCCMFQCELLYCVVPRS